MNEIIEQKLRERIRGFELLSKEKQKSLSMEEFCEYKKLERFYKYVNGLPLIDYPKEQTYTSNKMLLGGSRVAIDHYRFHIIGDRRVDNGRPLLYSCTHLGSPDYQIIAEAINDHAIPLAGDPETLYRNIEGWFLDRNGVVYCDVYDKLDRYVAKSAMIDVNCHGDNGMIFPEAFWNMSPNLLVMPLYDGVVLIPMEGNADIVPLAIEQYGRDFYINIGTNYEINPYSAHDKNYIEKTKEDIRYQMAALKLETLKCGGLCKRSSLGKYEEELKRFRDRRFNEYLDKSKKPYFSMATVEKRRYRPIDKNTGVPYQSPEEAYAYLSNIPYNEKTAFMFREDDSIPSSIGYDMYDNQRKALEENEGCRKSIEEVKKLLLKYK